MFGKIESKFLLIESIMLLFLFLTAYLIGTALADTSSDCQVRSPHDITKAGIDVNNFPIGVAVNPITNMIYVTNAASNTVSVINGENDKVEYTIPVGNLPYDVDVDPATNKIYVANKFSNSLSVIDGDTNAIIKTINVTSPVGIDIDSDNSWIYVTNIDNNTVSKVDAINNTVVKYAEVGDDPYTVDIKKGRDSKIYVTNLGSDSVSVIDGDSFKTLKNITVGKSPVGLAANYLTNKVYVSNRAEDTVSVIDAVSDTVVNNLTVGRQPDGIDINFRTNKVYVTNTGSSTVCVIDGRTDKVIKEIAVNNNISPQLSPQHVPPTLKFPNVATFIDNNDATNKTYVTNTGSSTVSVIDSNADSLLVGLTIKNNLPNQGNIVCANTKNKNDNYTSSSSGYIRVTYGKEFGCIAYPKIGYSFDFWSTNLLKNATENKETVDPISPIISYFKELFSPQPSPTKKFNVTEYGPELTANYKAGQSYIPALLIPVIFSFFIPFIIKGLRWGYKKLYNRLFEKSYMNQHSKLIDDAYKASKFSIDEANERLTLLRNDLIQDLHKGNSNDDEYRALETKISKYRKALSEGIITADVPLEWQSHHSWKNIFKIKMREPQD